MFLHSVETFVENVEYVTLHVGSLVTLLPLLPVRTHSQILAISTTANQANGSIYSSRISFPFLTSLKTYIPIEDSHQNQNIPLFGKQAVIELCKTEILIRMKSF